MKVSEWTIRDFRNNFFGRTGGNNDTKNANNQDDSYEKDAFDIEMENAKEINDKWEEFQKMPNL